MNKRSMLAACAGLALAPVLRAQTPATPPAMQRLGICSLLGNSVRIVARELEEVMFKDVAMDDMVLATASKALQERLPQSTLVPMRAPEQVNIDDQLQIGTTASERGKLPAWLDQAAQQNTLSHLLLVNCHAGVMEFRTGMSQVVGDNRVTGVGFFVSASGRTKNTENGAVSNGYLAPFVQLRLTLLDLGAQRALNTKTVGEGYIKGPPEPEAPDPWKFMDRKQKAQALRYLLQRTVARGVEQLLT